MRENVDLDFRITDLLKGVSMYEEANDWSGDPNILNGSVHYRLYLSRDDRYAIICVQSHDYYDYDARRILSGKGWLSESQAEDALLRFLPLFEEEDAKLSNKLSSDLRARLLAKAIRRAMDKVVDLD